MWSVALELLIQPEIELVEDPETHCNFIKTIAMPPAVVWPMQLVEPDAPFGLVGVAAPWLPASPSALEWPQCSGQPAVELVSRTPCSVSWAWGCCQKVVPPTLKLESSGCLPQLLCLHHLPVHNVITHSNTALTSSVSHPAGWKASAAGRLA